MNAPHTDPEERAAASLVRLHQAAIDADLPFHEVFHSHTAYVLLRCLQRHEHGPNLVLSGGNALAAHLGAEHRRLKTVELQLTGGMSANHLFNIWPKLAYEFDILDGLQPCRPPLDSHALDRGEAEARQFVIRATLGTAETVVRVNVEEGAKEGGPAADEVRMSIPSPYGLGEAMTMAVATPAAVFADAVETIVRRDALRVPVRSYFDGWMATQVDPLGDACDAIEEVFSRRGTPVPVVPPWTLAPGFALGSHAQEMWTTFVELEAPGTSVSIEEAVAAVREVAMAAFDGLRAKS